MTQDNVLKSRRIARNTLMLYVRMLFLMLIGFYTSRVVLEALGENDFGVYNVIGGVVAMFTVISGALNSAVSRFITFELGKGDEGRLDKVYSTAVTIQLILAAIVVILAEPAGLWFIENRMTIDPSRIPAARWVLHFSVLAFAVNLMSVPQMASITAHEKMSAYAGIGVFDGLLRLSVAFLILHSGYDRLICYAALMAGVVLLVRIAYGVYCRLHFPECRYRPVFDAPLVKEMFSFAGWNFIGVTSGVLRDHGGNILVNIFFGTAVNAARGVAVQLNGAVQGFVTNFMTAVNPQITKSYASGDNEYMLSLVRKSSRMSFYLLFVIALPILFNTDYLLGIWLKQVPDQTRLFVQLFLIFALSESLSNPLVTAQLATGNIRKYQIIVGGLQLLNLPVSYVILKAGAPAESTVAVSIVLSQVCLAARLVLLKSMIGLSPKEFIRRVYLNVLAVAAVAVAVPFVFKGFLPEGFWGFCAGVALCVLSASFSILFVGCTVKERGEIAAVVLRRIRR
jgi:O-antigen/teichoic acid export membrane protein